MDNEKTTPAEHAKMTPAIAIAKENTRLSESGTTEKERSDIRAFILEGAFLILDDEKSRRAVGGFPIIDAKRWNI
ncbi:MAG: hypothetical protein IJZ89_03345 [Clostridia bacterium]|nr:hypothetical protein [Clostridia bacterium]